MAAVGISNVSALSFLFSGGHLLTRAKVSKHLHGGTRLFNGFSLENVL